MISATQKAVSQPWCLAMVLNGSPDRKPPTEENTKGYVDVENIKSVANCYTKDKSVSCGEPSTEKLLV